MDLATFAASQPSLIGDSRITVVRIDPKHWDLEFAGISRSGESTGKTAKQWCESQGLTAAINAGMFAADYKTHVGFLRFGDHVNNGDVNGYQSIAAFGPKKKGLPRFRIFDVDSPGVAIKEILGDYASAIQNLRLIKRPRVNRWAQQPKIWSEAALGEDDSGRILFIFCPSPFSMHDLNQELLSLGIGLECAQHLEGGPEAQLYLRTPKIELELLGSYESAFKEDGKAVALPIPNVLGVRPRARGGRTSD